MAQIKDGAAVEVEGFTDDETGEPISRAGVIVSGGHTVDGVEHYDVQIEDEDFPGLIPATRISRARH